MLSLTREQEIKRKAGWFANCVRLATFAVPIPREIDEFIQTADEVDKFESYLGYYGLIKQSDDTWRRRI